MKRLFVLVIALMVITAPAFAGINLLRNPGFETVVTDQNDSTNGWTRFNSSGGSRTEYVYYTSTGTYNGIVGDPHSGASSWTHFGRTCTSGRYQTVSVVAGQTYKIDGWWLNYSDPVVAPGTWFEVGVLQGGWNAAVALNTDQASIWKKTTADGLFDWTQMSTMSTFQGRSNEIVATGNTLTVFIKGGSATDSSNKGRFRIDDMVLEQVVVPEPGTLAVMLSGIAGLGGLVIRRRK